MIASCPVKSDLAWSVLGEGTGSSGLAVTEGYVHVAFFTLALAGHKQQLETLAALTPRAIRSQESFST